MARARAALLGCVAVLAGCGGTTADAPTTGATATVAAPATVTPEPTPERLPLREIRTPSGAPSGGTVVLLHGGAWSFTGIDALATIHAAVDRFRAWGMRTVNTDYRAGPGGLTDVLRAIDRETSRPDARVCVYGESAGGLWALLAAARRSAVRCVIALAAPTDLADVPANSTLGRLAGAVFGARARAYSPVTSADAITVPVLLAYARGDTTVPLDQGLRLQRRVPSTSLLVLEPGPEPWLHDARVSARSTARLYAQERELLVRVLGG